MALIYKYNIGYVAIAADTFMALLEVEFSHSHQTDLC